MREWEVIEMWSFLVKLDLVVWCMWIVRCGGSCKVFGLFLFVVLFILVLFGVFFYLNGIVIEGGEVLWWLVLVYNDDFDVFIKNFVVEGVMRLMCVFFL